MKSAQMKYPKDFQEVQKAVSEYLRDMPNSSEKAQISAFFEKTMKDQGNS